MGILGGRPRRVRAAVALALSAICLASCANVDRSIILNPLSGGGGTVQGTVTDGKNPLAGVAISTVPPVAVAITSASGKYSLAGVGAQTLTVIASLSGFLTTARDVSVIPGQTSNGDLKLVRAVAQGSVQGQVTDGNLGLQGATVVITPGTLVFTTASDGSFLVPALNVGTYRIDAFLSGFFSGSTTITVVGGQTARPIIVLGRRADGIIDSEGVTDITSNPIGSSTQRVQITLFVNQNRNILRRPQRTIGSTVLNFGYSYSGLFTGQYVLEAQAPGFIPGVKQVTVTPPLLANGDIVMTTDGLTGAITGTIYSSDQLALRGAQVSVLSGASTVLTTATDGNGHYRAPRLSPGAFTVSASATGLITGTLQVNVTGGNTTDGTISLTR